MATETADRRASSSVASGATDDLGLVVLAAFTFASLGVMRVLGIDVGDFSTKDHLYVWFMSFALWFITWGILLTSGAGF